VAIKVIITRNLDPWLANLLAKIFFYCLPSWLTSCDFMACLDIVGGVADASKQASSWTSVPFRAEECSVNHFWRRGVKNYRKIFFYCG